MTRPSDDDHVRPALGAFVLGHLGPGEAAAVRAHLEGCAACRSEAATLAPVADLLPLAVANFIALEWPCSGLCWRNAPENGERQAHPTQCRPHRAFLGRTKQNHIIIWL